MLFPLPLQGHQTPMLQLANILYSNGFSISIIHTHINSPNPANHPHFTFHPIPELLEGKAWTGDVIALINAFNVSCAVPFRDCLSQMMSESAAAGEPVACLITDAIWHFTQAVADILQLPRIVLRTSNPTSFLSFISISLLREKGYLSATGCQLEESVPELPPLKLKDIPVLCTCNPAATDKLICKLVEKTRASKGLIFNSFEELEGSSLAMIHEDISIPVFAIGPFHKQVSASSSSLLEQDRSCISWLDARPSKSVLYVSFGSLIAIDEAEFIEIAWGLANSRQPFLWVIRPGLVRDSDGPAPLPTGFLETVADRGRIISWAPQEEVLAHRAIGGFWTHSGWNSTLESICEGVPMMCLPRFGDQRSNARYVTELWRVGIQFEDNFKREDVEKAIKKLMGEQEGREMRERVSCLKEKASLCLAEGGSSSKSLDSLVAHILSF